MFHVPRNAVYRRIDRRRFLELGGGAATALGAGSIAVGLNSVITRRPGLRGLVRRCQVEAVQRLQARVHEREHAALLCHPRQPEAVLRSHRHRGRDPDRRSAGRAAEGRHRPARRQGRLPAQLRPGQADRRAIRRLLRRTCSNTPATTRCRRTPTAMGAGGLVRELPRRLRLDVHARAADRLPLRLRGRLHLLPAGPVRAARARTSRRNTATGWSSRRTPPGRTLYEFAAFFKKLRDGRPRTCPTAMRQHQGSLRLDDAARHPAHAVRPRPLDRVRHRRQAGLEDAGADQLGRRAVGPDHAEVQGAGRRLPSRQSGQRHPAS